MENTIEYAPISTAGELFLKHRKSQEGQHLYELLRSLNHIADDLLAHHDRTCFFCFCEHFDFQCRSHKEHTIASYHTYNYVPLGIKEVEQFVIFMAAYELKTFIDEIYETSGVANKHDSEITLILNYCITNFIDNIYVVDYNERGTTTQESTSLLHKEENEEAIVPSKLGEEWDLPPSPPTCDNNSKTEYALDDGLILLNNPPYLEIDTMLCEDKNDELAGCDDALIHESPILFLKSPIYTIEEEYALARNYICGLHLPLVQNSYCNHDIEIKNGTSNYFERGKHANECHNKFNDPLYLLKISKLYDSNSHTIKFSSSNCNYYERGGYECPLYVTNNYMMHSPTNNMQWHTSICCDLSIYKMPMHRKKVRIRCYYFCVLCCFLPCFNFTIILIGMSTPWDPGIL
jgi:hypothetical protein